MKIFLTMKMNQNKNRLLLFPFVGVFARSVVSDVAMCSEIVFSVQTTGAGVIDRRTADGNGGERGSRNE